MDQYSISSLIEQIILETKNKKILLCVSGGKDSYFLFVLFYFIYREQKSFDFAVAYYEHNDTPDLLIKTGLEYVCKQKNIDFFYEKMDPNMRPCEKNWRKCRYDFLFYTSLKNQYEVLVMGHHINDRIESFLMRATKGCNLNGLIGMKKITYFSDLKIYRPLLNVTKQQIEYFVRSLGFREDWTNFSLDFERARIRKWLSASKNYRVCPLKIISTLNNLENLHDQIESDLWTIMSKHVRFSSYNFITINFGEFIKLTKLFQLHLVCIAMNFVRKTNNFNYKEASNLINFINQKKTAVLNKCTFVIRRDLIIVHRENAYIEQKTLVVGKFLIWDNTYCVIDGENSVIELNSECIGDVCSNSINHGICRVIPKIVGDFKKFFFIDNRCNL